MSSAPSSLFDIRWTTFEAILSDLGDRRGSRIAYDRGTLEIMSPSREHEPLKTIIGRLVEVFTLELGIKISSCGSTTLKSVLKEKGAEPDECYYIQNEESVRGHRELDLARDPPPDVVLEVDIPRSSVDRRAIYAEPFHRGAPRRRRDDPRPLLSRLGARALRARLRLSPAPDPERSGEAQVGDASFEATSEPPPRSRQDGTAQSLSPSASMRAPR